MKNIREIKDYQIIILGIVISIGVVFSTFLLSNALISFQKMNTQTLTVTGSASQDIKSDIAVWTLYYDVRSKDLKTGYSKINSDKNIIKNYLALNGLNAEDYVFTPVSSYPVYKRMTNGYDSNEIDGYRLSQNVKVTSSDVDKVSKLSENLQVLIDKNIETTSNRVEYFVSNLDKIKIQMLAEATKDAKQRAESMVKSTGGKIGVLNSAKMGVFQIVGKNSTDVSDYGIYNTTSKDKKINAVVNASFTIK